MVSKSIGRSAGRVSPPARDETWKDFAVCRGIGPENFFYEKPRGGPKSDNEKAREKLFISRAKTICSQCPVRIPCLNYSIQHSLEGGIWGGMTEDERRAERRRRHGGGIQGQQVGVSRGRNSAGQYI